MSGSLVKMGSVNSFSFSTLSGWASLEDSGRSEYEVEDGVEGPMRGKKEISPNFRPFYPNTNVPQSPQVSPPFHQKGEQRLTHDPKRPLVSR